MKKQPKWQQKFLLYIADTTNDDLFKIYLEYAEPDGQDGGWTNRGAWYRDASLGALRTRLYNSGFLTRIQIRQKDVRLD